MAHNYAVYKNGKIIKTGFKEIRDERTEEEFILKMQKKYMTKDSDVVDVWFR